MCKSLREYLKDGKGREITGYGQVVREERFFCAVLFHLLTSDRDFLDESSRSQVLLLALPTSFRSGYGIEMPTDVFRIPTGFHIIAQHFMCQSQIFFGTFPPCYPHSLS